MGSLKVNRLNVSWLPRISTMELDGMSDIEGKNCKGSSERMEPPGGARHRWENREVEWSFGEKRHRRQSREGSGEEAGTRPSFKWAAAHESTRATSEFQWSEWDE
jgi:hypothetical protein